MTVVATLLHERQLPFGGIEPFAVTGAARIRPTGDF
jgi:hypothetical protein